MAQISADNFIASDDPQTYAIIGACMTVHRTLGHGFLEAVYQEALAIEFSRSNVPFIRGPRLHVFYDGNRLATYYEADFICYGSIVLELKAVSGLDSAHVSQVINALKATCHERGLLVNFGAPRLQFKRLIWTAEKGRVLSADDTD